MRALLRYCIEAEAFEQFPEVMSRWGDLNGSGIFRQAEVPSRHSPGGVGIGLAIARHLVELHGGTIEVASEREGCGATFTVKLPLMTSAQLNDSI